jgi:transcriptional regulator with XRE-family HTH domain
MLHGSCLIRWEKGERIRRSPDLEVGDRITPLQTSTQRDEGTMSLAQRVRDYRYSKGWGPDELASRAEISRTALYQIESGKTELPRAGTLRRIAVALDVPMEELLGNGEAETTPALAGRHAPAHGNRAKYGWSNGGETPANGKAGATYGGLVPAVSEEPRLTTESLAKPRPIGPEATYAREGELMSKLHDLLHSPFGECITGVVDSLHRVLAQVRSAG